MKKSVCAVLSAVFAAVMLSACQATPDTAIVKGKDNEKMIETAKSIPDGALTIAEQVNAPERIEMAFSDSTGRVMFNVDAAVILPGADTSKIIRVTPHEITQSEVDRWTQALFGEQPLYTAESFDIMTKADIQEEMLNIQKALSELDASAAPYTAPEEMPAVSEVPAKPDGGEPVFTEAVPEEMSAADMLREALLNYENSYKNAPDEAVYEETTNKLEYHGNQTFTWTQFAVPDESGTGITYFNAANNEGLHTITYVDNGRDTFTGSSGFLTFEQIDAAYGDSAGSVKKEYDEYRSLPEPEATAEEAADIGNAFLAELDITGYVLADIDAAVSEYPVRNALGEPQGSAARGWQLAYTREIDGIPVTYQDIIQGSSPEHGEWWSYEKIMLFVTDAGVTEAYVEEQYDIGETLAQNCRLMDFESIMDIFKKMMPIEHSIASWGEGGVSGEYGITRAEFGYVRIADENADYSGLLVPAWSFFGNAVIEYNNDAKGFRRITIPDGLLLTVNAVDGSVIDMSVGY